MSDMLVSEDDKTTRFLFWNVHHSVECIRRAIEFSERNSIDVIALCESPDLHICDRGLYVKLEHYDINKQRQIEVLVASSRLKTRAYFHESCRFCIARFDDIDINAVIVHLNSKMYNGNEELRDVDINSIHDAVERIERRYNSKSTVIFGDFNIGLFDRQMLSMVGLNARLFRYQMEKGVSTRHGLSRDLYYNPMLTLYHDSIDDGVAKGTYYYENSQEQWHCLDHVLLKKPVLRRFDSRTIKVLSKLENFPLVRNNRTITEMSDHLPVYFEIANGGYRHEE